MSNDDFRDKIAAMHAEVEQYRSSILELAGTVCDYRKKLKQSRQFAPEESFMLTMQYQETMLGAIFSIQPRFTVDPDIPDFPPDE